MTDAEFDRDDPDIAKSIMEEVCPAENERRLILSQLLRSIAVAEQLV